MLEQLQFTIGSLGQDRRAEGLHNLLHGHRLSGELILCRTAQVLDPISLDCGYLSISSGWKDVAYQTRPNAPMPTGCKSVYLREHQYSLFLPPSSPEEPVDSAQRMGGRGEGVAVPGGNFEGRSEDLRTHELRHLVGEVIEGDNMGDWDARGWRRRWWIGRYLGLRFPRLPSLLNPRFGPLLCFGGAACGRGKEAGSGAVKIWKLSLLDVLDKIRAKSF